MHKRVYRYTAVNHHITSHPVWKYPIWLSCPRRHNVNSGSVRRLLWLHYTRGKHKHRFFLCILCIKTYNKANMTNKHNQQNQTRPLATSATDRLVRWAYASATAAATKNRPSTCFLLKRDRTIK